MKKRLLRSDENEGKIVPQRPHHINYTSTEISGEEKRKGKREPYEPFYYNYND